jgi:ATP-binding cassette subfamily B (MDR/TAP) protein 1
MVMFTALGYWAEAVAVTKGPMDGKTSSFIEQILSSVRIVQSFDMAPKLLRKLQTGMLAPLKRLSTKTSATRALEQAAAYGAGFLVYSLAFWYGGISVQGGLSVGNFLTVSRLAKPSMQC